MIRKLSFWIIAAFLGGLFLFILGYLSYGKVFSPGPLSEKKTVIIPQGTSTKNIGVLLEEKGVIDTPFLFRIVSYMRHRPLQAGEYAFYPWISLWDAIRLLNKGDVVIHRITIPEGLTSLEVVKRLNGAEALQGELYEIPPEGSLLPSTYYYVYDTTRQELIARMRRGMEETLLLLWDHREENLPILTPQEALILASIVEKEAQKASERRRIAGVFVNRLRKGMPLQADPTVIFALTKGRKELDHSLSKKDLKKDHPYNTYTNLGLPPSPICNPGRATIEAVLHPLGTKEFFFVADGSGGHIFSTTYKNHAVHHQKWRQIKKKKKKQVS